MPRLVLGRATVKIIGKPQSTKEQSDETDAGDPVVDLESIPLHEQIGEPVSRS